MCTQFVNKLNASFPPVTPSDWACRTLHITANNLNSFLAGPCRNIRHKHHEEGSLVCLARRMQGHFGNNVGIQTVWQHRQQQLVIGRTSAADQSIAFLSTSANACHLQGQTRYSRCAALTLRSDVRASWRRRYPMTMTSGHTWSLASCLRRRTIRRILCGFVARFMMTERFNSCCIHSHNLSHIIKFVGNK